MGLWHYKLIPVLPDTQLIAQWRELNAIFSPNSNTNHILINYIYNYDKWFLHHYTKLVTDEMLNRGMKIKSWAKHSEYFQVPIAPVKGVREFVKGYDQNYAEHDHEYLLICYYNLLEKHLRGQKDLDEKVFASIQNVVCDEIMFRLEKEREGTKNGN